MTTAIIYSSTTGNTRKIATAIHAECGDDAHIYPVDTAPSVSPYDLVFVGGWVDRGEPDAKIRAYLHTLSNTHVAVFMTLGASPESSHAATSLDNMENDIPPSCTHVGSFICRGAIAPALMEWMKKLPPDHPHAPNPARLKRWAEAAEHPDEQDCMNAREFAGKCLASVQRIPL